MTILKFIRISGSGKPGQLGQVEMENWSKGDRKFRPQRKMENLKQSHDRRESVIPSYKTFLTLKLH